MAFYRTGDPVRDAERYYNELEEELENAPRCDKCGELLEAYHYDIDGEIICDDCLIEHYRRETEW